MEMIQAGSIFPIFFQVRTALDLATCKDFMKACQNWREKLKERPPVHANLIYRTLTQGICYSCYLSQTGMLAEHLILLMQEGHHYPQGNDNTDYCFPVLEHDSPFFDNLFTLHTASINLTSSIL